MLSLKNNDITTAGQMEKPMTRLMYRKSLGHAEKSAFTLAETQIAAVYK